MVFKVTNSLTNSTKTEQNQDSLIRYLEEEHNRASNLNYTANIHISNIDKKNQVISEISCELPFNTLISYRNTVLRSSMDIVFPI